MKIKPSGDGFIAVLQPSKFHAGRMAWVIKRAQ